MASLETTVTVPEGLLFRELEGEAILLDLNSGEYFGLDNVATEMWLLLSRHGALEASYQELLSRYEVSPERLRDDLLAFVEELESHRLLDLAG